MPGRVAIGVPRWIAREFTPAKNSSVSGVYRPVSTRSVFCHQELSHPRRDDISEHGGALIGVVHEVVKEARVFRHLARGVDDEHGALAADAPRDVVVQLLRLP